MTEREKAKKGYLYDPLIDPEMAAERMTCARLCYEYNHLRPEQIEKEGQEILRKLFARVGETITINPPFHCDYGYNIEFGENFFANYNVTFLDAGKITFGHDVFVAPNCGFYTAGHPLDVKQRNEGLEYAYPIKVGNNVWIGGSSVILPGVTIGDNTVIGAGSVVNKDIPAGVIAVGNPCRVIRKIEESD